jgi:hypothetical protein
VPQSRLEPDHFGISLAVTDGELPAELVAAARSRRPDVDPGCTVNSTVTWMPD